MDRDRLLLGIAAVFAGLTVLVAVTALATQPFLLVVAVPFGGLTYLLWYQATGRLEERVRASADERRDPRADARDPRSRFSEAGGPFTDPRSRFSATRGRVGADGGTRARSRPAAEGPSRAAASRTLGVDPDASESEIRRAYRERVKEVHPDTETGDEESFKEVARAYERLSGE